MCTPFPRDLFCRGHSNDKDFDGAIRALEAVPPVTQLATAEAVRRLPERSLALLNWLLVERHAAKGRRIRLCQLSEVQGACQVRVTTRASLHLPLN